MWQEFVTRRNEAPRSCVSARVKWERAAQVREVRQRHRAPLDRHLERRGRVHRPGQGRVGEGEEARRRRRGTLHEGREGPRRGSRRTDARRDAGGGEGLGAE